MTYKNAVLSAIAALSLASAANAQVLLSGGLTYSQNFDTLLNTPAAGNSPFTENVTLVGWYASRSYTAGSTSTFGPYAYTGFRIGDGSANNGTIWSMGTIGNSDRALTSLGSGTPKTNVFGVRIQNDTALPVDTVTISYTGEQWRNGGNTAIQTLSFSYMVGSSPVITSPLDVSPAGVNGWIPFTGLSFNSPTVGAAAATLDGNLPANQVSFVNVLLTGVTLNPGQEIFLRWLDPDDGGNDHGLGVDNFSVSFAAVPEPATAALAGLGILGFILSRRNRS